MEIGDSFKIVLPKSRKKDNWSKCKTPDKEFVIKESDNYYIHYDDLRTNISCNCRQCSQGDSIFNLKKNMQTSKTVPKSFVIITQRKFERERDRKLKLILRK